MQYKDTSQQAFLCRPIYFKCILLFNNFSLGRSRWGPRLKSRSPNKGTPVLDIVLFFVTSQKRQGGSFTQYKVNGEHWTPPPPGGHDLQIMTRVAREALIMFIKLVNSCTWLSSTGSYGPVRLLLHFYFHFRMKFICFWFWFEFVPLPLLLLWNRLRHNARLATALT